jgi:hypothetical protein
MVAREKEIAAASAGTPQGAPKMKAATPRRTDLEAKE